MTPNDLIKLALKMTGVLGIGQTASSEDVNDAFALLNMMLAQWARKRWLLFHMLDVAVQGNGSPSYTIGPAGDINIGRPTQIESAYLRLLNGAPPDPGALVLGDGVTPLFGDPDNRLLLTPTATPTTVDVPLSVVRAYEDWATLSVKLQPGFPQLVFLDTSAPLAKLLVWPVPSSDYEVHVIVRAPLLAFERLTSDITLPQEYEEALLYNLAGRLRPAYGLGPDPTISALATAALNTIRSTNAQVPLLGMPPGLARGTAYNITTDRYR